MAFFVGRGNTPSGQEVPQGSVDIFDAILLIVIAVGLTTFLLLLES